MDEFYMKEALNEAINARDEDEIPIGAVVVQNGKIIGRGYNQKQKLNNPIAHAEIIAMNEAMNYLNSKYLDDCTLYVTLEPCIMCTGAIINIRVGNVVVGSKNSSFAGSDLLFKVIDPKMINHHPNFEYGLLQDECEKILKDYFKTKRGKK